MKTTTILYALVLCMAGLLPFGAPEENENGQPLVPGLAAFYVEIPPKQFFSACLGSYSDSFSYLVESYGDQKPEHALSEEATFSQLPSNASNLNEFTVAVIIKPQFLVDHHMTTADISKAQYDADLSCINKPTGCMARSSQLKPRKYCMVAINPKPTKQYAYLGCTQSTYNLSNNIDAEREKLASGAPKGSGDPFIPPVGFEPAFKGNASGDGSNLKDLITSENDTGENNASAGNSGDNGNGGNGSSASHVYFESASLLLILLSATVFVL